MLLFACCAEQQTKIELVSSDSNCNLGEINVNSPTLSGKEWLIKNTGNAQLRIDSVELSCECLTAVYDSVNTVRPNDYFPFRVLVKPDGALGDFYREIRIYGNFENSPLELTVEGIFVKEEQAEEKCDDSIHAD